MATTFAQHRTRRARSTPAESGRAERIRFSCAACGKSLAVAAKYAGRSSDCGETVRAPRSSEARRRAPRAAAAAQAAPCLTALPPRAEVATSAAQTLDVATLRAHYQAEITALANSGLETWEIARTLGEKQGLPTSVAKAVAVAGDQWIRQSGQARIALGGLLFGLGLLGSLSGLGVIFFGLLATGAGCGLGGVLRASTGQTSLGGLSI